MKLNKYTCNLTPLGGDHRPRSSRFENGAASAIFGATLEFRAMECGRPRRALATPQRACVVFVSVYGA